MLRIVNLLRQPCQVKRTITNPTKGVVLIDCVLDQDDKAIEPALHYRLGTWTKPPVDISIGPSDGRFRAVQFVLQDETVQRCPCLELPSGIAKYEGVTEFDRSAWPVGIYYIDEQTLVTITWIADDTLCISLQSPARIMTQCAADDNLAMFFDSANQLIGFHLFRLTLVEKSAIRLAE